MWPRRSSSKPPHLCPHERRETLRVLTRAHDILRSINTINAHPPTQNQGENILLVALSKPFWLKMLPNFSKLFAGLWWCQHLIGRFAPGPDLSGQREWNSPEFSLLYLTWPTILYRETQRSQKQVASERGKWLLTHPPWQLRSPMPGSIEGSGKETQTDGSSGGNQGGADTFHTHGPDKRSTESSPRNQVLIALIMTFLVL